MHQLWKNWSLAAPEDAKATPVTSVSGNVTKTPARLIILCTRFMCCKHCIFPPCMRLFCSSLRAECLKHGQDHVQMARFAQGLAGRADYQLRLKDAGCCIRIPNLLFFEILCLDFRSSKRTVFTFFLYYFSIPFIFHHTQLRLLKQLFPITFCLYLKIFILTGRADGFFR